MIWSLGKNAGRLANLGEQLGFCISQGENNVGNVGTGIIFRELQLGAHPGDDLHDDPGAGLLEHRHR